MNDSNGNTTTNHHRVVMKFFKYTLYFISLFCMLHGSVIPLWAGTKTCGSFFLRDKNGEIINPLTEENSDKPFSTRKTCGACHDYETITQGFHFQQGWDRISDTFSEKMPWVLSDGMMGKH